MRTTSADAFRRVIERGVEHIYAGDVFQVNLAQRGFELAASQKGAGPAFHRGTFAGESVQCLMDLTHAFLHRQERPFACGVLAFDLTGTFHGRSSGYSQRAAGLAVDGRGRLLVHPGSGQAVRLSADGVAPSIA